MINYTGKSSVYVKYLVDFFFSLFVIIFILPFLFVIFGTIIKLTTRGPIIFKHKRVGVGGKEFYMYKFRTMCKDAELIKDKLKHMNEADGPVFKIKDDPRITKIGRFLRKTSIDEFPQFINVIKGDMSIIGPRPPLRDEVNEYKLWQRRRLSMKPGITCLWQIMPNRNDIPFEDWMKLDLEYIDNWSLKLDFYISIKTVKAILNKNGQ